ncbi:MULTISPECIES: substrate-binding domain-containing protein [Kitasatospora]|uniref:substrate-binding domain-containing protein n=1 Tax=Kitasatospora TaxID=2063 RepID=UPI000C27FF9E|nr:MULTISPECIES: substrate-binding domain-containing protein [Kitasatospora]PJN22828.1 amino acid ABC transporter substrate-binding protein [Kitasatospora sp. CB02891]GGQ81789.1 ABC transporter substrate-binding protein [Kitasatospora griseola]
MSVTDATPRRPVRRLAALAACVLLASACAKAGTAGTSAEAGGGDKSPVKVGLVYSKTGPLAAYGKQYLEGFKAGLSYATKGTNAVGGHPVEIAEQDDAGDPAKAVSAAKDLIGKNYKILAGSTASGVALQVGPIAAQNKVLFISGPAAADKVTGLNKYTFRSGRQSYQDTKAAASFIGDAKGKKVTVLAQDNAFGQANVAAVKDVLGGEGATVEAVLAPPSATDLTPFATQAKAAKPDLLFVAWAGDTASALWTSLNQQDVFSSTKVVTGLDVAASYPLFGPAAEKIDFLNHYFSGAAGGTEAELAMNDFVTKNGSKSDLFTPDGFTAAQMVVHALEANKGSDTDTDALVKSLEGWSFDGVKGKLTVRAEDHALLQPMFQVKLTGTGAAAKPTAEKVLSADQVAPPVAKMAG